MALSVSLNVVSSPASIRMAYDSGNPWCFPDHGDVRVSTPRGGDALPAGLHRLPASSPVSFSNYCSQRPKIRP
jgi:hypothetical protein